MGASQQGSPWKNGIQPPPLAQTHWLCEVSQASSPPEPQPQPRAVGLSSDNARVLRQP